MAKRNRDRNQREIVDALERIGCSVVDLSAAGVAGLPDLLVGRHGRTLLLEVKTPIGKLRPAQTEFFETWRGTPPRVVRSVDEALRAVWSLQSW